MKMLKYTILISLLLSVTFAVTAQTTFRYKVKIKNTYPETNSSMQLDLDVSPNVIPATTSYYNPFPPAAISGPSGSFVYCGGDCQFSRPALDASPYVIYTLLGPNSSNPRGGMTKLLTCKFAYGWSSGNCLASAIPLTIAGAAPNDIPAACKATASNTQDGCDIEFKFYYPMSGK